MPAIDRRTKVLRAAAVACAAVAAWPLALPYAARAALTLVALFALADLTRHGARVRALGSDAALGCVYALTALPARALLALLRIEPLRPPAPPEAGSHWVPRAGDPPPPRSFTRMR